jgi:hypothetical protein
MASAFLEDFEMAGLKRRMLLVFALVLLAGPIQVALAEANAIEIDVYSHAVCQQDIQYLDGTTETILMKGEATVHVFFEGPEEGTAYDDDGDTLDEVQTQLVELSLSGNSVYLGSAVHMHLSASFQSAGEMEEITDSNTGILDVPPFAQNGTVESLFDIFFEVEMLGQVFFGEGPMRWRGLLREKPAGPLDFYENQADIRLLNAVGVPSGFHWGASRFRPNPPVEIDVFDTSIGSLVLTTPSGQEYAVGLMGQSEIHVFFEGPEEGSVNDDDGDGLDEVETELVGLSLSGSHPELREVHLRLNRDLRSLGEMEETADSNTGVLDVPPFASEGMIDSFFDVYFEIEFADQVMYGQGPMRLRGVMSEKPAAPGDIYEFPEGMRLVDARGDSTGYVLSAVRYEPRACGDAEHPYPIGDLNKDCEVNFVDVAMLSLHWLDCTRPQCY